jgi:hypothetical protein
LPKNNEIQNRASQSEKHHGDANGSDVHSVGQLQGARSGGESANSYQKADTIERDESAANALQDRQEKRRPVDESGVDGRHTCGGNGRIEL